MSRKLTGKPVGRPRKHPLTEKPVFDDNGHATTLTLPVKNMSVESYKRELRIRGKTEGFAKLLGTLPLEDLKYALACDNGARAMNFLAALIDPKNAGRDMAELAVENKISLGDLMTIWRNDRLTLAMKNFFDGIPRVTEHTAFDAETTTICCPRCDGAGEVQVTRRKGPVWIKCPSCEGTGKTRRVQDARSRDHILKATGVLKTDGPMVVVNNNNQNISGPESVLDELDAMEPRIIDLELDDTA